MINIKKLIPAGKLALKAGFRQVIAHKETALTIIGVAGLYLSVGMALKMGPELKEELEDAEAERYEEIYDQIVEEQEKGEREEVLSPKAIHSLAEAQSALPVKEKATIIFKKLWPLGLSTSLTTACVIGSNRLSARKYAALAALYALSETELADIKDQIKKEYGPRKLQTLEDAVTEEQVKRNPPPMDDRLIINTGDGTTLCQDYYTGRYFYSDAENIRKAINRFARDILGYTECSQNEWYDEINLPHVPYGYSNVITDEMVKEKALNGALADRFTSVLANDDIPVLLVRLNVDFKTVGSI